MAKVHLRVAEKTAGGRWILWSACGKLRKDYDLDLATDIRAVTCKACLRTTEAATRRIKFYKTP